MATAGMKRAQVYTIHGPPGLPVAAFLRERAITLSRRDVLVIAEHDEATEAWLECDPSARAADRRRPRAARPHRTDADTDTQ